MASSGGGAETFGMRERLIALVVRQRRLIQAIVDGLAWGVALVFASLARFDFSAGQVAWLDVLLLLPLAALSQLVTGIWSGLYTGRWRFGSFDEVTGLVPSVGLSTVILFVANLWFDPELVARSVPLAAGFTALVLMGAIRYAWRLVLERRRRPRGEGCQRLLIFGAGEGGAQVVTAMLRDTGSPYFPVALLDDDPRKRNLEIMGVRVVGGRSRLAAAAGELNADALLVAIPRADAALVTELSELAAQIGLPVKVLPSVRELFGARVDVSDIRDLSPADLLGRHEIETDLGAIAGYLTGKRVLVTGAGGSIGSELCRQVYTFAPAELIMVDRDESALHAVQLSIDGRALLDSRDLVLLDLRDRAAVEDLLGRRKPHVVFHAAALKHLPLLERHPAEAVKTNVWGSLDLLEASIAAGVERFVNISTDKAANPCSVLGYSKRITERLTAYCASRSSTICLSVRFGNVLGSRGSVLVTFQEQIERGGPITVTDPEVARYFMTVQEAVQLVIQAAAIGSDGEVLVLDMGEPVKIADVARLLAARSERPVAIQFTGLRAGEKLHEVRLADGEMDRRPVHPLISHVEVPPLEPALVRRIDLSGGSDLLVRRLAELSTDRLRAASGR